MNRPNDKRAHSLSCQEAQGFLPDYANEELDQSQHLALESHLDECADCREELESLGGLFGLLEMRTVPDPGESFFREARAQVHGKIEARRRWTLRDLAPKPALSPVFAAAAMLLFLLLWWTLPDAQKGREIQPFLAQLEQEATSSLMDLSLELAGGESEIVNDLLPTADSDDLIANLSESELDRLAERLEEIMG
jgi:predicted anti-sigma-YlaC factor YlaD